MYILTTLQTWLVPSLVKSTTVVKELWGHRSREVFFCQPNISGGQKKVNRDLWPHNFVTTQSKIVKIVTIHYWNVLSSTVKFQSSNPSSFEDNVQDVP